jgi:hypothetical protein
VAGGNATVIGNVVFHKSIREHEGVPSPVAGSYMVGRSYIDLGGVRNGEEFRNPAAAYTFSPDPEADLFEEIVAKARSDSVLMVMTPHVIGTQLVLSGALRNDTLRGRWTLPAHHSRAAFRGRFTMWKVQPDGLLDSATIRSRRATGW